MSHRRCGLNGTPHKPHRFRAMIGWAVVWLHCDGAEPHNPYRENGDTGG
jgi:hypothetical protein